MTHSFHAIENTLNVVSERGDVIAIEFNGKIAQVLDHTDVILVRTETAPGQINNENVHGITKDGRLAWTIPPHVHLYPDSPYIDIRIEGYGVRIANWDGLELLVNLLTGAILSERWGK